MGDCQYNVFIGAETGLLKGVNTAKQTCVNLNPTQNLSKKNEITAMCWGEHEDREIYLGLRNQTVKIYDTKTQRFTNTIDVSYSEGPLKGLAVYNGDLITCTQSGGLAYWAKENQKLFIDVGSNVCRMRQNPEEPRVVAVGGKENDLKVLDLQKPDTPIFRAKNVQNDFLDLRVPIWVCDMQFVPQSDKIVTVTGHHQIRMYDPSARQRRPVIDMEFDEYPIISLSLTPRENQYIVGNSRGRMALIDLRRKALVHVYKGFAGSIRWVQCHPTLPIVASCGLDRFLRIHDLNSRKLLNKMYVKSRLNCLLMKKNFEIKEESLEESAQSLSENIDPIEEDREDEIWDKISVASDEETRDSTEESIMKRKINRTGNGLTRRKKSKNDC